MSLPLPPPAIDRNIRVQPFEDWEKDTFPGDEPLRADVEDEEPSSGGEVELPPLTMAQWRARDLPKPDLLLGHWLSTTSRVLISAPTGLGKSNLVIALGQHIAAGLPFLHWEPGRRAKVLYIDGEMARRLLRERIFAEEARHGGNTDYFHVLSHEDVKRWHPLNTPQGQAWVLALVERLGVELVVFDNIMSLTFGDQTNELVWQLTMPLVLALTARSVGQVWVHHTGHDENKGYGTKTREWSVDTVILLEEVKRDDTDVSFSMNFRKARERTPATRFDFQEVKIALVHDRWEHDVTKSMRRGAVNPSTRKALDALIDVLAGDQAIARHGGRRVGHRKDWETECNARGLIDIAGNARSARSSMNRFRRDLVAANMIACDGDLQWLL